MTLRYINHPNITNPINKNLNTINSRWIKNSLLYVSGIILVSLILFFSIHGIFGIKLFAVINPLIVFYFLIFMLVGGWQVFLVIVSIVIGIFYHFIGFSLSQLGYRRLKLNPGNKKALYTLLFLAPIIIHILLIIFAFLALTNTYSG